MRKPIRPGRKDKSRTIEPIDMHDELPDRCPVCRRPGPLIVLETPSGLRVWKCPPTHLPGVAVDDTADGCGTFGWANHITGRTGDIHPRAKRRIQAARKRAEEEAARCAQTTRKGPLQRPVASPGA